MSIFSHFKPISTALLPNAESDDIKLVLKSFLPWNWGKWRQGKEIDELENKFKEYFGVNNAVSFSSGRAGLYAILSAIASPEFIEGRPSILFRVNGNPADGAINSGLRSLSRVLSGDRSVSHNDSNGEVILQAYTTIALPLAIKQAGFIPIYVDIKEDTFNIDPEKIEAKITERTKAIIVQHTFGIPAEMDKISEICKKYNLFLIEDCAHSLGAEFTPSNSSPQSDSGQAGQAHSNSSGQVAKKIGTFGDATFFSFGRDKIISATSGGMVIAKDGELAKRIKEFQNSLNFPSLKWIFQQLMHPLIFWCALPVYYFFNIGKIKIILAQKLGIISRAYNQEEKKGIFFPLFPYSGSRLQINYKRSGIGGVRGGRISQGKLPNVLAILILNQFKKLERFNDHRREIAEIYEKEFHYDNMNYHSEAEDIKYNKNSFHYDALMYHSEMKLPEIAKESKPTFLYYTIQVDRRDELLKFAAKNHIILGDWFPGALGPKGIDEKKFGYKKRVYPEGFEGDCPIAERVGSKSLNLPTNIKTSEKDAVKIVDLIKNFLGRKM